jgi:sulfide dehydrogenase cytochrome subunit
MHPYVRSGALALIMLGTSSASADGPSAEAMAFTCAGCHGTDGSSVGDLTPLIAGMNEEYFVDVMKAYREDNNNPTIMNRMAKAYTDEQIEGMARFFSRQKPHLATQTHDAAKAKRGAELHEEYCEKCHEDGGRDAGTGTLAGQWAPYLYYTMADFMAGKREMPKKMKRKVEDAVKEHGDAAIDDLIHFYASRK